MLKGLALDIDGTLLNDRHELSDANVDAVRSAATAGSTVVLVSARSIEAMAPIRARLAVPQMWFVACQGAITGRWQSTGSPTVISEHSIAEDDFAEVSELALAGGFSMGWFWQGEWFVWSVDDLIRDQAQISGLRPRPATKTSEGPARRQSHKIVVVAPTAAVALLDQFVAALPVGVEAAFSHPYMVEITAAGVTKASGLTQIAIASGLSLADFAAIGDGLNDVSMLAVTGRPVAMGNAEPAVHAAARWVTKDNNSHGVAHAIARLTDGSWQ